MLSARAASLCQPRIQSPVSAGSSGAGAGGATPSRRVGQSGRVVQPSASRTAPAAAAALNEGAAAASAAASSRAHRAAASGLRWCMTGSASAHAAQYAAARTRSALHSPKPPNKVGMKASERAASQTSPSASGSERRCCSVRHMALSNLRKLKPKIVGRYTN